MANVPKAVPLVCVQVIASVPDVVQSPDRSPLVITVPPENFARFPLAGDPDVVTVPDPEGAAHEQSPRKTVVLEHVPDHSA